MVVCSPDTATEPERVCLVEGVKKGGQQQWLEILQGRRSLITGTTLQCVPRFTGPILILFNFSQLSFLQRMGQDFFPLFFSFLFFQPYSYSTGYRTVLKHKFALSYPKQINTQFQKIQG